MSSWLSKSEMLSVSWRHSRNACPKPVHNLSCVSTSNAGTLARSLVSFHSNLVPSNHFQSTVYQTLRNCYHKFKHLEIDYKVMIKKCVSMNKALSLCFLWRILRRKRNNLQVLCMGLRLWGCFGVGCMNIRRMSSSTITARCGMSTCSSSRQSSPRPLKSLNSPRDTTPKPSFTHAHT